MAWVEEWLDLTLEDPSCFFFLEQIDTNPQQNKTQFK